MKKIFSFFTRRDKDAELLVEMQKEVARQHPHLSTSQQAVAVMLGINLIKKSRASHE